MRLHAQRAQGSLTPPAYTWCTPPPLYSLPLRGGRVRVGVATVSYSATTQVAPLPLTPSPRGEGEKTMTPFSLSFPS